LGGGTLTIGGNGSSTAFAGTIGGLGALKMAGSNTLVLAAVNTYTGGTLVQSGILDVQHDGGLGSGNVTVSGGGSLKLEMGTSNSYISAAATLTLTDPATVNLAFAGTDTISNLVINGIQQASGTWGSSSSSAANKDDAHFSGIGVLSVGSVVLPPPPSPTILPVHVDSTGTNLMLRVATTSGYNYVLESATNLAPPIAWSVVTTNLGNGGTITNLAPISPAQRQIFFRYLAH
jgi:autotransporter-associated beta strand protein